MGREPQILACSGRARWPEGSPPELAGAQVRQAMRLSGAARPRVCMVPTAMGDWPQVIEGWYAAAPSLGAAELSHLQLCPQPNVPDPRAHLMAQDVIFVWGGSVVNLLALWRAHRLDEIMHECWQAGVVLAGGSAGSLCWHGSGVTDSFSDALDPLTGGLGFLPFSNGVHDDSADQPRRTVFRELIAAGTLPDGYATEDGTGLHYVGTSLHEALCIVPGKSAWQVTRADGGGYTETALPTRHWLPPR
ncbi:MAG TPA: peptidase E [Streptosporangiaceae bacterium]|jgi:peptidase E